MKTPNLNIELSDNFLTKSSFATDINIIPNPVAIYLPLTQEVFLNNMAYKTLDLPQDERIDMRDFLESNKHLIQFARESYSNILQNKRVILNLPNNTTQQIEFSFSISKDDVLGHIYFVTFKKISYSAPINTVFSLSMVKEEISKLKENLNSEGKNALSKILKEYFNEENKQLSLEDMVNYEKELQIIQRKFPVLSRREVIICGLLLNNMDLEDIAKTTDRTLNSVFVTIHRINKKTDIPNKNELVRILQETIAFES